MQCGCFLSGFSSQSEIDKEVFKGKKANHYDYEDDDDERQKILENEKYVRTSAAQILIFVELSTTISKQNNVILSSKVKS